MDGIGRRRAGQEDVRKEGVVEGYEEGGRARGTGGGCGKGY